MPKPRKHYSKEEKLEIVKQALDENVLIEDLAKRYAVHPNTIYKWHKDIRLMREMLFLIMEWITQREREKRIFCEALFVGD